MIYAISKYLVRVLLFIFYKRVEIHGRENIADEGPVIFACNHPNMLFDPLCLGAYTERKVHFLAKSTLFGNPIGDMVLNTYGVIPVYRHMDGGTDVNQNQSSFSACFEALERGEAIGIFPEGTSHAEPYIMNFKTGVARIALEAEEKNDYQLGIKIVPVGLNYRDRHLFRSSVLVVYGPAMDISDYFEDYKKDPRPAVRALTNRIHREVLQWTISVESKEDARLIEKLETIYRKEFLKTSDQEVTEKNKFLTNLTFNQTLIDGYNYFRDHKPDLVNRLRKDIDNYLELTDQLGVHPDVVGYKIGKSQALFFLLTNVIYLVLGFPIALWGWINNVIPYQFPRIIANRMTDLLEEIATFKFAVGLVVFPLFYLGQTALVYYFTNWQWAAVYLATLPIASLITLSYMDHAFGFMRAVRNYFRVVINRKIREDLEEQKEKILQELDQLSTEYFAYLESRDEVGEGSAGS